MAAQALELTVWLIVLLGIIGLFCSVLLFGIRTDSARYDLEFLWSWKYTEQDLHLDRKPPNPLEEK